MKILGERRRNPLLCRSSTRCLLVLGSEDGSLSLQAQGGGKTVFTEVTTWRALLREGRARFERDVAELQPEGLLGGLCLSVGVRQQQGTAPTWTGWFTLREALSTANKGSFPDKICLGRTGPKADNPRTAEKVPEWGAGTAGFAVGRWGLLRQGDLPAKPSPSPGAVWGLVFTSCLPGKEESAKPGVLA